MTLTQLEPTQVQPRQADDTHQLVSCNPNTGELLGTVPICIEVEVQTAVEAGSSPTPFIPEAKQLADRYAQIVNGEPTVLLTESLLGIPTTAHILGGAVMGRDRHEGVIDKYNQVFGYKNMLICDGSMISANPGVNPSLTITALSERAMGFIPPAAEMGWEFNQTILRR